MDERGDVRSELVRYLRQRIELGEAAWFLEHLSRERALELLRAPPSRSASARAAPAPASAPLEAASGPAGSPAEAFVSLRQEVLACTLCRLAEGRKTVVFGEGDPEADLLVIGEAPGFQEDRSGRPFVGPAGQLLDKMLLAIGFHREEVFICNVLKCRPPDNRDPLPDEVASCRPYLRKQVELIAPKVICAFGRFAAQTLLNTDQSLGRLRESKHDFMGIPVIATYHPAALLRNTKWKRPAWEDLKLLRNIYDESGGRTPRGDVG